MNESWFDRTLRPILRRRAGALLTTGFAVGILAVAAYAYAKLADAPDIVRVELGGSIERIRDVVCGNVDCTLPGARDGYVDALGYDGIFIAGYVAFIILAALVGRALAITAGGRRIARMLVPAALAAGLCDVAENLLLWPVVRDGQPRSEAYAVAAQGFAFTKWAIVVPALAAAVAFLATALWRGALVEIPRRMFGTWQAEAMAAAGAVRADDADDSWTQPVDRPLCEVSDGTGSDQAEATWLVNSTLPAERREDQRALSDEPVPRGAPQRAKNIGVCVSGGGIRSATFALGALDALRDVVRRSRYLVSVSGGGYATSALQLALQPPRGDGQGTLLATPADVYNPGSLELDHTRRHGKYIADGMAQWVTALGSILRGVLVNLLTIGLVVVVAGRLLAHTYAAFPDNLLHGDVPWAAADGLPHGRIPGVLWAAGILAGLALATWVLAVMFDPARRSWVKATVTGLRGASHGATGLTALIVVAGIALPMLSWVAHRAGHTGTLAVTVQPGAVLAGYLAALTALNHKERVRSGLGRLRRSAGSTQSAAGGRKSKRPMLISAVVYAALAVIAAALLLLLGMTLASTGGFSDTSTWPGTLDDEWLVTAILAVPLAFLAVVDQVRWSLHPFYRRRLASAFAVRRLRRPDGRVEPTAYDYSSETTDLATFAKRVDGFPQVIFSCAAHVSGQDLTPPGRHVVPWTMSGDYIGSPRIGWVRSDQLTSMVSETLRRDLTVQAAAAISGAAVASEMGRSQGPFSKLLTLTNVRLGSWLPNPVYMHELFNRPDGDEPTWWRPQLPRRRYLGTLAEELVGRFRADGPLVYVTDGGHYENLGLVELLRHRCGRVYCVDASNDHGDIATTLASAISLAYEELGVVITLRGPGDLGAGPGTPLPDSIDQLEVTLRERFARECIVRGDIRYPALGDLPEASGELVFGKAVLTGASPFTVLAHAARNPTFPYDSTGDQWYDHAQFNAYHALGRYVGARMVQAAPLPTPPPPPDTVDLTEPAPAVSPGP